VKRYAFLDWMRGLAVLIMIQCHVFNAFTRPDLRHESLYVLTQFIGGMAAPLFLFMAGMTSGFQIESMETRMVGRAGRWRGALRRAGYVLVLAFLFRFTNFVTGLPNARVNDLFKVDILNCMALALGVFSCVALFAFPQRLRLTLILSLAIAAVAPVMNALDWSGFPIVARYYLVPGPDRGQFPFFPCAAYVGFGLAAGSLVKKAPAVRMDALGQWAALFGCTLIFGGEYFANLPYSLYPKSDFWRDSPALILIRVGIALVMLAAAYLWTEFCPRSGWSWVESLGKTSLLVYWVHVLLVYGGLAYPFKRALTPGASAAATLVVILLMVALSGLRLRYKARGMVEGKAAAAVAGA